MSRLFYTLVSCRELWLCSSLQLIMPVKECVIVVLHLIVSCRELWLCSSLQLIMPVPKCVVVVLHLIVSWRIYACNKMCHDCSTPYCFLHKTRTMFVFATNYACNKCVMVVLHFIGGFIVVVCRELWLCSSLQLIMSVPKCAMIVLHLTVSCKELRLCSSFAIN